MASVTLEIDQKTLEGVEALIPPATSINLSHGDVVMLWEDGILSATAYVYLALRFERADKGSMFELDVEDFIDQWSGSDRPGMKVKRLTPAQVQTAIAKFNAVGRSRTNPAPIQLSLID